MFISSWALWDHFPLFPLHHFFGPAFLRPSRCYSHFWRQRWFFFCLIPKLITIHGLQDVTVYIKVVASLVAIMNVILWIFFFKPNACTCMEAWNATKLPFSTSTNSVFRSTTISWPPADIVTLNLSPSFHIGLVVPALLSALKKVEKVSLVAYVYVYAIINYQPF